MCLRIVRAETQHSWAARSRLTAGSSSIRRLRATTILKSVMGTRSPFIEGGGLDYRKPFHQHLHCRVRIVARVWGLCFAKCDTKSFVLICLAKNPGIRGQDIGIHSRVKASADCGRTAGVSLAPAFT